MFSLVSRPFCWASTITRRPRSLANPPTSAGIVAERAIAGQLVEPVEFRAKIVTAIGRFGWRAMLTRSRREPGRTGSRCNAGIVLLERGRTACESLPSGSPALLRGARAQIGHAPLRVLSSRFSRSTIRIHWTASSGTALEAGAPRPGRPRGSRARARARRAGAGAANDHVDVPLSRAGTPPSENCREVSA